MRAKGNPEDFATKGTVREERGLTSSTYRVSSGMANWML